MAELAETAPTSRERSLRVMSSGVQGFLQTAGSRVQRQKSQKRMVCAEIPHLGIPEQRVLIKPRGQKRPRAPSATMTRLRRWQRPAAGNGSQDDCSRAHVCVSCLTAQLEGTYPRPSGQTWTQVAGVGSLASSLILGGKCPVFQS